MQAHTEKNGWASVQNGGTTGRDLCVLLSVAVIAVVIVCYTMYDNYLNSQLDELLLQEGDVEFLALKLSQERSSTIYWYMVLAIISLVVLGLWVYYNITHTNKEETSPQTEEMRRQEHVFCKMYDHSNNLERQLLMSDAESRVKTSQYKAHKDFLRRRHKQELDTTEERHRETIASQRDTYEKKIADLHTRMCDADRQVKTLQQKCKELENQLQYERGQKEELMVKVSTEEDKVSRHKRSYELGKHEWEKQKKALEHGNSQLRHDLKQLEQHYKEQKEQDADKKLRLEHCLQMSQEEKRKLDEKIKKCAIDRKHEQQQHAEKLKKQQVYYEDQLDLTQRHMSEKLNMEKSKYTQDQARLRNEKLEQWKELIQKKKELETQLEMEKRKHTHELEELQTELQHLHQQESEWIKEMQRAQDRHAEQAMKIERERLEKQAVEAKLQTERASKEEIVSKLKKKQTETTHLEQELEKEKHAKEREISEKEKIRKELAGTKEERDSYQQKVHELEAKLDMGATLQQQAHEEHERVSSKRMIEEKPPPKKVEAEVKDAQERTISDEKCVATQEGRDPCKNEGKKSWSLPSLP